MPVSYVEYVSQIYLCQHPSGILANPNEHDDSAFPCFLALHRKMEQLVGRIVNAGALLVIVAGRQGAMTHVVASRICTCLSVKDKRPAMVRGETGTEFRATEGGYSLVASIFLNCADRLDACWAPARYLRDLRGGWFPCFRDLFQLDTETFMNQATTQTRILSPGQACTGGTPMSSPHLDSPALSSALAALLGQARASGGLQGLGGGTRAGETGAAMRQWCDVVIIHGSQALDLAALSPEGFGLSQAEAMSVFVDTVPQVRIHRRLDVEV